MINTCGIFIFSGDEILLVHHTNNKWNDWNIPERKIEESDNDIIDILVSTVLDETNIDIEKFKEHIAYIDDFKFKNKILKTYILILPKIWKDALTETTTFKCSTVNFNKINNIYEPINDIIEWIPIESIMSYNMLDKYELIINSSQFISNKLMKNK